jgi:hypothetical protein
MELAELVEASSVIKEVKKGTTFMHIMTPKRELHGNGALFPTLSIRVEGKPQSSDEIQ